MVLSILFGVAITLIVVSMIKTYKSYNSYSTIRDRIGWSALIVFFAVMIGLIVILASFIVCPKPTESDYILDKTYSEVQIISDNNTKIELSVYNQTDNKQEEISIPYNSIKFKPISDLHQGNDDSNDDNDIIIEKYSAIQELTYIPFAQYVVYLPDRLLTEEN